MTEPPRESGRGRIVALVLLAVLLAGSLWLVHRLSDASAVQDCVASGRPGC